MKRDKLVLKKLVLLKYVSMQTGFSHIKRADAYTVEEKEPTELQSTVRPVKTDSVKNQRYVKNQH